VDLADGEELAMFSVFEGFGQKKGVFMSHPKKPGLSRVLVVVVVPGLLMVETLGFCPFRTTKYPKQLVPLCIRDKTLICRPDT
jgi:hypothetical protein